MFKRISESLGHVAFFTTFLIASISFSGLIFFDSLTKGLKLDTSILDLDFYALFIQVVVLDENILIGRGLVLIIILFITLEFFPKAITFFIGIFHFIGLICIKFFKEPFLLIFYSIAMVFISLLIVFDWCFFNKISYSFKKIGGFIVCIARKFNHFSKEEQNQIKEQYKMEESYKDYEKGSFWIIFVLGLLMIWLCWLIQFGKAANRYVDKIKTESNMTHNIYIRSKDHIYQIPCIFVSKVKSGYLVMVKDTVSNKPVIYPDSVIYKLENKD